MILILSLFFGLYLGFLPISGWNGGNIYNLILPVVSLSLPQIAIISRMMRSSTIETLNSNFIRTARAKGIPKRRIITKHVIRSSILPIIDYLAPATAGLMTGSIIARPNTGTFRLQDLVGIDTGEKVSNFVRSNVKNDDFIDSLKDIKLYLRTKYT